MLSRATTRVKPVVTHLSRTRASQPFSTSARVSLPKEKPEGYENAGKSPKPEFKDGSKSQGEQPSHHQGSSTAQGLTEQGWPKIPLTQAQWIEVLKKIGGS